MIEFEKLAVEANEKEIISLLDAHQIEATGVAQHIPIDFSLAAYEDGTYIGGITASNWMNTTHVSLLAIDKNYRKHGLGSKLLIQAEQFAQEQQAEIITISTQDYQAKGFYEKHGYTVFGQLADSPFKGTTKYYLEKRLTTTI
ncbi:GNAT family N-acetyltransferase [Candidatus Enterococcus clewellii]|uniref:N-acetyltransferase domain-containing protein n=1 Tax=Candidatus Enterococcus clewellii TaxID=1834193 RepID=A0A242K6C8_9ENTE|nr:GNAT family N-acetyltransferase [Enterococcus sp. 9E7_DIV0242]OTP15872.1 hypothetical protein A5888_002086 [Enterococcus sp. 9E7_DIV0242]